MVEQKQDRRDLDQVQELYMQVTLLVMLVMIASSYGTAGPVHLKANAINTKGLPHCAILSDQLKIGVNVVHLTGLS